MEYLRLFERDATSFGRGALAFLPKAFDVVETREINEDWSLEFKYPKLTDEAAAITDLRIVVFNDQAFRICRVTDSKKSGKYIMTVLARHVFYDTEKRHVTTIADMPGAAVSEVVETADEFAVGFTLVSEPDGCISFADCFGEEPLIDWWCVDKSNVREVLRQIIEYAGCGEIYIDNFDYGLCWELGTGEPVAAVYLGRGLDGVEVESDTADIITRLWAYGENDLTITSENPTGEAYILSDNADEYGTFDGFLDFSEETDPAELYNMALWQFDSRNAERLDEPIITVTGTLNALALKVMPEVGDTVRVCLPDAERLLRVIKREYYPYEIDKTVITLGRMKKDLYLYMRELNRLRKKYKKVSNDNGNVVTNCLSGILCTAENVVASEWDDNANLTISDELIKIKKDGVTRVLIGNDGSGKFRFCLMNDDGDETVDIDDNGDAVFTGTIEGDNTVVNHRLVLSGGQWSQTEQNGIHFVDNKGNTLAQIIVYSSGNIALWAQNGADAGEVYIGTDMTHPIVTTAVTDALAERISALEGGS